MKRNIDKFLQIFVDEKNIELREICGGVIKNKIISDISTPNQIMMYISMDEKIPLDIILKTRNISCRRLDPLDISSDDIENFIRNRLISSSGIVNTAIYYKNKKNFVSSKKSISICELNLDGRIITFLEKLSKMKNKINSVSCWPIWIIDNYFQNYQKDNTNDKCSIFITYNKDICDIMAYYKESIVCYRQYNTLSNSFDEHNELQNVIKYISQNFKISYEEFSVYSINEENIDMLVYKNTRPTKFISLDIEIENPTYSIINFKNCIRATICLLFCIIILQIKDIISLKSSLSHNLSIISSIDKDILDEKEIWNNIDDKIYRNINIERIISSILENTEHQILLRSIEYEKNNESHEIHLHLRPLNKIETNYSKNLDIFGYNFSIDVMDDGIECHGAC